MGEYQDNKKQGTGTFFYPDGSKYEGERNMDCTEIYSATMFH